jgi:hypothetical protein
MGYRIFQRRTGKAAFYFENLNLRKAGLKIN